MSDTVEPERQALVPGNQVESITFWNKLQEAMGKKWGPLVHIMPVVSSAPAHYVNLAVGVLSACVYIYFAIVPPKHLETIRTDWSMDWLFDRGLPLAIAAHLLLQVVRAAFARNILTNADLKPTLDKNLQDFDMQLKFFDFQVYGNNIPATLGNLVYIGIFMSVMSYAAFQLKAMFLVSGLPWIISNVLLGPASLSFYHGMSQLCRYKVATVADKLVPLGPGGTSLSPEQRTAKWWSDLTQEHMAMDQDLQRIWSLPYGAPYLFCDIAVRLIFGGVFGVATYHVNGLEAEEINGYSTYAVTASFAAASAASLCSIFIHLQPLAEVTDMCTDGGAGSGSIAARAGGFCNHKELEPSVMGVQNRFMSHVNSTKTGIEVPVLDKVISKSLLYAYANTVWGYAVPIVTVFMQFNDPVRAACKGGD